MKRLVFAIFCISLLFTSCKDNCEGVICFNGGVCADGTCVCPPGFEGNDCGTIIDPCADINCNNGDCDDGICTCDSGYEGEDCSIESRDKFIGAWQGPLDGCFPDVGGGGMMGEDPIITITKNTSDVSKVNVTIGTEILPLETTGSIDGNSIIVDEATTEIDIPDIPIPIAITFSGNGEIINGGTQVAMDLTIDIALLGVTECSVVLDKQ